MFASGEAIYARLSRTMQAFLDPLIAVHSWGSQDPDALPVEHPVVHMNPRTGRKSIYVNRMYTRSISGLTKEESDLVLAYLNQQASGPEVQARVSWKPGTVAIWDNESTLHYLVRDYEYERIMHRVMVFASPEPRSI